MRADWELTTLGDICSIQSGAGFPTRFQGQTDGPIPFFKVSDMNLEGNETALLAANNYITEEVRSVLGAQIFPEGSVVFPKVGGAIATNKKRQIARPSCVDNNVMGLVPDVTVVDGDYLHHWMQGQDIYEFSNKANPPSITQSTVRAWPFLLPPLEEQKRIVAILDQAFAALDRARALAEANLADAQELQENTLESMFRDLARPDWMMSLANAVHPECKLSYGIVQPGDDVDGGLPIVRPVDLKTRVITLNTLKRIAPERAEGYARTQLVGGELLLCVRGSTGEVSVASESLAGCNVTRGIVPIRFDTTRVLPEFAFFQFRSRFVRDQIAAKTYGAALMQINIKDLRELDFVVPPVSEQRKAIARAEQFLEGGDRLRDDYKKRLTDLANLRQSLLQKAFSGQLT